MMLRKAIAFLLLIVACHLASAQYNNPIGRVPESRLGVSIGGKVGSTVYFGDLVDGGRARWTVSGFGEKTILPWLSIRASIDVGQCKGLQKHKKTDVVQIEFMTTFGNLSALGKIDFLDLIQGYDDGRPFNPYFALGIGGVFYSCDKHPHKDFAGNKGENNLLIKAKRGGYSQLMDDWLYSNDGMQICAGAAGLLGVRYAFSSKIYFLFEMRGDILFTDRFDGHDGWPDAQGNWHDTGKPDALWTLALGCQYRFYDFNKWSYSSKFSRKSYLKNRNSFERNARRMRRR